MRWNKGRSPLRLAAAAIVCLATLSLTISTTGAVGQSAGSPAAPPAEQTSERAPEFFVMIDPAHGGDDKGATLGTKLSEKDLTLALARELKKELQARGIPARLVRDSDVNLALERRAEITNENHAGLYVALHAGTPGAGVRVYSCALPPAAVPAGRFLPWESAQAAYLERSRLLIRSVAPALRKKGLQVAVLASPLRPLNNVAAPAIAVELAAATDTQSLQQNSKLRSTVASAIADGIAQARGQPGVPGAPGFGATGWKPGVPGAPGFGTTGWKPGGRP
jgi:N-acetylmuramoyl-L-alanine amidase